jgi:6-phosphogluconolactonase (cycloisomerase 2 family)
MMMNTLSTHAANDRLYLLVGTYAPADKPGIYTYAFDQSTGDSTEAASIGNIANPSYLTVSADGRFVYAVAENHGDKATANAFSLDAATGGLKFLNSQETGGDDPCYINTDAGGKYVITANYSGGTISVFRTATDGSLQPLVQLLSFTGSGVVKNRQEKPHLHSVLFSPDGAYLFACDLGTDQIHKFSLTPNDADPVLSVGTPSGFKLADGSGPRHLVFHPNGKLAYSVDELSGKVNAWDYANGTLTPIQNIAAAEAPGDDLGAADIHLTPDGKFLYASVRGKSNHLAMFGVNDANGKLTLLGYQPVASGPRNFVISPNGKYLLVAGQNADSIQIMEINSASGLLKDSGKKITVSKPVCLKFVLVTN